MHKSRSSVLKKWLLMLLLLALLLAACAVPPEDAGKPEGAGQPEVNHTEIVLPGEDGVPSEPIPEEAALELSDGTLWLLITQPQDGALVHTPEVIVAGEASAGSVLTINDLLLYLETQAEFSAALPLVESTNVIEILASDAEGHQVSAVITVFYEPLEEE